MIMADLLNPELQNLVHKLMDQQVSFKTARSLIHLKNHINSTLTQYRNQHQDLLLRFSKKTEEGNPVTDEHGNYTLDNIEEFTQHMNHLLNSKVDIPVAVDDLIDITISANELLLLNW